MNTQQKYAMCRVSTLVVGDIVQLNNCDVEVKSTNDKKVYVSKVSAAPGHGLFSIDVYSPHFADGFNRVVRLVAMDEAS